MNYLRDEIVRYKQNSKTAGNDFGKAKLRLYNLSSISDDQLSYKNLEVALDAWEVVLKDFKISQNKDKPFFYSYSIEFIGLHKLGTKRIDLGMGNPYSTIEGISSTVAEVGNLLTLIADAYAWCEGVRNTVGDIHRSLNNFKREVAKYQRMITGIVSFPTDVIGDVIYGATDVYKTVIGMCEYPADLALSVIHGISALRWQIEAVVAMGNPLVNIPAAYGGIGKSFELERQNIGNLCNGMYAAGIKSSTPASVLSDSYNSDMAIVTYGTGPMVTVTSETTLEALALKYFGNADMSELIALYNRISGDADLVPGMYINIPILDERSQNKANMVFAKKNRRDSLGVDIRLDASGRMVVADYGDFETVSGVNNLNQALLLRLTESLGNRTRLNMYGIKAAVGSPGTAVSGYLATSILDTAMQDPRIKKIDNLAMNGNEDNLALSFDYTCDDGKTYHFSGAV